MKLLWKFNYFFCFQGGGAWVRGVGCQGGWEQRSEACVKIQKKMGGGVGSGGFGLGGSGWM